MEREIGREEDRVLRGEIKIVFLIDNKAYV